MESAVLKKKSHAHLATPTEPVVKKSESHPCSRGGIHPNRCEPVAVIWRGSSNWWQPLAGHAPNIVARLLTYPDGSPSFPFPTSSFPPGERKKGMDAASIAFPV
uniref:Uncharacterized protein n=1 Tax=Micrurus surinamensis TaxID=129470 RepID=A0A2D4PBE2_MICSU